MQNKKSVISAVLFPSHPVPLRKLAKGAFIVMTGPLMLLSFLIIYEELSPVTALYGFAFLIFVSLIAIYPYLSNLSALTDYVHMLSVDKHPAPPDLSFLNNVEELSEAVYALQEHTKRKRDQLEASVTEWRLLINTIPDGLIMLDGKREVVRINNAVRDIYGRNDTAGGIRELLQEERISRSIDMVERTERPHVISHTQKIGGGAERYFLMQIVSFPADLPSHIKTLLTMHDITEQKRAEQMLVDFVANASHEIRTPLTTIIGSIETLQDDATPKDIRRQFLSMMQQQAERMRDLIEDLLSISRIEQTMLHPPSGDVSIAAVLQQAVETTLPMMNAKDIRLIMEANEDGIVKGDGKQLRQVFENLLTNAVKYSPEASNVTVKSQICDMTEERGGQCVKISIIDEGVGIKQEHIPRLTERFYRVDDSRAHKGGEAQSTGLGLFIVKQILIRHNAHMEITSTPSKGSTFCVYIPLVS